MPVKIRAQINLSNLNRLIGNLDKDGGKLVQKIALQAESAFVHESPVDTGALRANFFVSENEGDNQKLNRTEHRASNPPEAQTLIVHNNIGYVSYANVTSYRPNFIEKAKNVIAREIERISLYEL